MPTIPGTEEAIAADPAEVAAGEAKRTGFPLMIKASGGGGRGMRVVMNAELPGKARRGAARSGSRHSGRAEVFLERYIARAKHIEVQISGTRTGNLRTSGSAIPASAAPPSEGGGSGAEHQPAGEPAQAICDSAATLCRSVNYRSAGTVEFLLDTDPQRRPFHRSEPRIQVEHTVTEVVTGIDLFAARFSSLPDTRCTRRLNIPQQER